MSDPKQPGPAEAPKPQKQAQPASAEEAAAKKPKLDLGALDLSVERVEERISPSETNVFDK